MSKKCPKCESNNVHLAATVPHALCVCFDCRYQWKNKYKPRKKTVFQKITASPEVLAEEFVEPYIRWGEDGRPETLWRSNFRELSGILFDTKEEALAATVARLKEVAE